MLSFANGRSPCKTWISTDGWLSTAVVNVSDLNKFKDGTVVDTELLIASGLVKKVNDGVKILGNGELTAKLTVKAAKFSQSAIEKIEKAGGKAEVM